MQTTLIFHAGAGEGEHSEAELVAALATAGMTADPCPVDAEAIRAALASNRYDRAVVAGGDAPSR